MTLVVVVRGGRTCSTVMCQGERKPCWAQLWLYCPLKGGNLAQTLIGATCSLPPSLICFSTELPPVLGMCRNTWSSASCRGHQEQEQPSLSAIPYIANE